MNYNFNTIKSVNENQTYIGESEYKITAYLPFFQYNVNTSAVYNMYGSHYGGNLMSMMNMYCMCDLNQQAYATMNSNCCMPQNTQFMGKEYSSGSSYSGYFNNKEQMFHTKNDINMKLLKDFNYTTRVERNEEGKSYTVYCCQQAGCDKEFLRTNNLLDHVRMHAGIKPHQCKF